jgi:N4-gp56 family major capsid protein
MPNTTISTANRVQQWDEKYHAAYIRKNRFKRYMGTGENSIIQVKEELTRDRGEAITIPLLGALDASAGYNTGSTLEGNELALPNDGFKLTVGVVRNAVSVTVAEEKASPVDIREAGKQALMDLQMRYLRNDIIKALGEINGVAYALATEAQKDTWVTANSDRVLFGNDISNYASGDHSASLLNIASSETLTRAVVSKLKRIAQTASAANGEGIRPYMYGEDEESYVLFVGPRAFRDLRNDIVTGGEWKDAMERGQKNPLFSGPTSIYWDGIVVREIPEIATLGTVGASSALVSPVYLCGAQALAAVWGKRTKTTLRSTTDYDFVYGVGFMELRKVGKFQYGQGTSGAKDWGVVTGYVAAAADA